MARKVREGPLGRALALVFVLQFVLLEMVVAGPTAPFHPRAALGCLSSVVVLLLLLALRDRRAVRAFVAGSAGLVLFCQILAVAFYHAPIDRQIAHAARAAWPDVRAVLVSAAPWLALGVAAAAAFEWSLLSYARASRFRYDVGVLAVLLVLTLTFGPELDRSSPDLRFVSALRVLGEPREGRVSGAPALPILPSSRRRVPSVLLVITESVRATDYASSSDQTADTNPEVDALVPSRIGIRQMRATASYTTISVAALLTSRPQLGTREEIARAPSLFDFGRRIRVGGEPVYVAYYADQSVTGVFERADVRDSCDRFVCLEDLERDCPHGSPPYRCTRDSLDARILDLFEAEMPRVPSPAIVVLHLYNTHVPYAFADADAKFRPYTRSVTWEGLGDLHNAYKNAILAQDKLVARAIRAFDDSRKGSPTVIIFTSDHGEAFGEHHGIHHGQSLYDEQIHVPAFVAASSDALSPEALSTLQDRAAGPASHYDVLPTILDAMGVWDSPALASYRGAMLGTSLLSRGAAGRAVPLTSCNASSPCPVDTWGMLGDDHELVAQSWDGDWKCVKLDDAGTPDEDAPECVTLRARSKDFFAEKPGGRPNR